MSRQRSRNETPLAATGEFTLWVKDKIVTRYQVTLEGVLPLGRKRIVVRQTSETRIHDVGRTTFEVPDEARLKLAQ